MYSKNGIENILKEMPRDESITVNAINNENFINFKGDFLNKIVS